MTTYPSDIAADVIYASGMPTSHLIGLALTVPVNAHPGRNELYGRSHAFYSIAADIVSAIEFITAEPDDSKRRRYAARALGLAGYRLADLYELAISGRAVPGRHVDIR